MYKLCYFDIDKKKKEAKYTEEKKQVIWYGNNNYTSMAHCTTLGLSLFRGNATTSLDSQIQCNIEAIQDVS